MSPSLASVIDGYLDLRWRMNPVAATMAGVHEHDGRLADWSETGVREFAAAVRSYTVSLEEADADTLDDEIDRTAVLHAARHDLLVLEREQPFTRDPTLHVGQVTSGIALLRLGAAHDPEARAVAIESRIAAVPEFLATARVALTDPASTLIDAALEMIPALQLLVAGAVDEIPDEASDARSRAYDAIAAFASWLGEAREEATDEFAIGRPLFDRTLNTSHMIADNADVLARYAERLKAESLASLDAIARGAGKGVNWRDLIAEHQASRPEGAAVVRAIAASIGVWRELASRDEMASIPPDECLAAPMPTFLQWVAPSPLYVSAEAIGDGARATIFVAAGPSYAEAAVLGAHDGVPGRHLFRATARRSVRPARRVLRSTSAEDGWSLYAESLIAEHEWTSGSAPLAFIAWHLLRSAIMIELDVALHTRDMSRADAERVLRDELGMESGASSVVSAICALPTRALAAAIGRRDILALREDVRRARGPSFELRRFHDEYLSYGALPPALARWGMLNDR
ncbi:MAG: DUF885 family protein [Gemmatimonadaceae bacterium]